MTGMWDADMTPDPDRPRRRKSDRTIRRLGGMTLVGTIGAAVAIIVGLSQIADYGPYTIRNDVNANIKAINDLTMLLREHSQQGGHLVALKDIESLNGRLALQAAQVSKDIDEIKEDIKIIQRLILEDRRRQ